MSLLVMGPPAAGKTTLLRAIARTLADDLGLRVIVIDTSNEIGGDGDVPHPAIGRARRMQVGGTAQPRARRHLHFPPSPYNVFTNIFSPIRRLLIRTTLVYFLDCQQVCC